MTGDGRIRVFLVDDHEIVRRGLRELLDATDDLEVVGEADTAEAALELIPAAMPDVALLDVRLPGVDGIRLCRELRARHPALRCLMLTSFPDDEALFASIMAGSAGYLLKHVGGDDLTEGLRRVARGESLIDPTMTAAVLERLRNGPTDELDVLSDQERRVLEHIGDGLTNRQIAQEMSLAEKTVKNYVSHVLAKLGMGRRTEAAAYAARLGERGHPPTLTAPRR